MIKLFITESQMKYLVEDAKLDILKKQFGFISDEEWEKESKQDLSRYKSKDSNKRIKLKPLTNPEGDLLALTLVEETPYIDKVTG
jgi:hypothetical protein